MSKFNLVEAKIINMCHFTMLEGKFVDQEQAEAGHEPLYVYANISTHESEFMAESDVRFYAHPFETMYCPEDYELYSLDAHTENVQKQLLDSDAYAQYCAAKYPFQD